jgi:glycosyltransferase involved in cell wall biosynthesis
MTVTNKTLFVSWAPYSRRSQSLCAELNIKWHSVHFLKFQRPAFAPAKYILQAVSTLALLLREHPRLVFVQDPPIFASLVVYIYTVLLLRRVNFIVDAHTGALLHPWWKPFRGLQKYLYRRALTVITTNQTLTDRVKSWGANSMVLVDPPAKLTAGEAMELGKSFNIMLVNTFSIDEPLPAALEGVADLPNVHLFVTGDLNKADPNLLKLAPPNVTFTGFLSDQDYLKLMKGVQAVMVLTDEDFTLQSGAIEATALGKPILISDLSFLRDCFNHGTIHVSNTPAGIRQGIIQLQSDIDRLANEILELRCAHQEKWHQESQQLRQLVATI